MKVECPGPLVPLSAARCRPGAENCAEPPGELRTLGLGGTCEDREGALTDVNNQLDSDHVREKHLEKVSRNSNGQFFSFALHLLSFSRDGSASMSQLRRVCLLSFLNFFSCSLMQNLK